ncbi:MAG: protein translocase subunit SecF [Alphaproteobacteria bacterium]
MFRLKLVPVDTAIDFVGKRLPAYALSGVLVIASLGLFFSNGLNFGIDFRGGIMIEIGLDQPVEVDAIREVMATLDLGDVSVQEVDPPIGYVVPEGEFREFVLIRAELQPGGDPAQRAALATMTETLIERYGTPYEVPEGTNLLAMEPDEVNALVGTEVRHVDGDDVWTGISLRRSETVGPKVSGELIDAGITAVLLAVGAVLVYIWFRFEWQFGVGAVVALVHDVILTIGFFSLTQLEFNLSIIAALLTIVGYSLNDTVVVYDRVRENLRRYRKMPLPDLFNKSINETLARTVMTSVTTLLALGSLYFFGGEVIQGFTAAMIWGVFIGTYSSIFVAVPFLLVLKLNREHMVPEEKEA